ncbi:MAG: hypothetical protein MJZ38_06145 [archaeon]|nr:hypothetical protein [archaeon]
MSPDAKAIIERINERYSGVFGKFQPDSENDEFFATALHPIEGNRHTEGNRITVSVEEDVKTEYANRVDFVDDKTRPSIMGKPVDLSQRFGFDEEHGRLNNFSMMGAKGGYVFFTGHKEDVLFCAELHVQKRHMTDEELAEFMDIVVRTISE